MSSLSLSLSLSLYIYIYIYIYGSAVYQWCRFKSRRGKNKNLTALKSNSNTVWFNFQTYIIFSINLVSFKVTLRSSGTDILYGCHLLLDVCIIYFISCDCIMNSSLSYTIYLKTIAELDCCQIIILSIYIPSTHAYTHVLRLSLDLPYEKR